MAVEATTADEKYWKRIERIVDAAPPPTPEQLARLAELMRVDAETRERVGTAA